MDAGLTGRIKSSTDPLDIELTGITANGNHVEAAWRMAWHPVDRQEAASSGHQAALLLPANRVSTGSVIGEFSIANLDEDHGGSFSHDEVNFSNPAIEILFDGVHSPVHEELLSNVLPVLT